MPSAMSRPSEPVDTASTSYVADASPRRMTEPLPNCFSIWPSAAASAFLRFSSIVATLSEVGGEVFSNLAGRSEAQARLSVHLHSNSMSGPKFFHLGERPFVEYRVLRAALPDVRLHQRERFDRPLHRCDCRSCRPALDVANQCHVRAKLVVLAQLEAAFPQSGAQPVDDGQQLRRRACGGQGDQIRAAPEFHAIKMQHKLANECQLCCLTHVGDAIFGNRTEKNDSDVQIAGGDGSPERGVGFHFGGQSRPDRVRRPQREEQTAILHTRSSSSRARATVWRLTASRSPEKVSSATRVSISPSARQAQPNHTVPTGLPGCAPSGPAMPVIATAT